MRVSVCVSFLAFFMSVSSCTRPDAETSADPEVGPIPVTPNEEVPSTVPPETSAKPLEAFPRAELGFTDHLADEGAWSTTTLGADGSFESEHEMSDGGRTSTVTQCSGRIDASIAKNWLARMKADATLSSRPDVPGFTQAMDQNLEASYRIHYFDSASDSAWVDPAKWDSDRVRPLFERMGKRQNCKTFKRE